MVKITKTEYLDLVKVAKLAALIRSVERATNLPASPEIISKLDKALKKVDLV